MTPPTMRNLAIVFTLAVFTPALGACARHEAAPAAPAPAATPAPVDARPAPPDLMAPPAPPEAPPDADSPDASPPAVVEKDKSHAEHRHAAAAAAPTGELRGSVGKVQVGATLARAEVEKILRGHVAALRACYEGELAGKSSAGGRVDIGLTISERGWVTLGQVKRSTLAGGDPEMCIVKKLGELRFPKPTDGQDAPVSFTLEFRGARAR